ncbi:holo-(acyl-carrier-protein) synthase [Sphaerochaeta pleomorpha str. Grapes]|uniref:Holo-[acyl-carrier-protein] synthase n=1 Tax=Sphaerochaeta pleomorpha (strain ATCC BAA-1885 / DSM 22778 / Grapes) TaxID=158190 RepID=G8QU17_SPHPG|nr:holo-ACP synthase [Sphaerochaeta pleomorpha]AEV30264.1 holo-(acyl-carrier-protein) synthase [Sphaerochaeta pleomorpha str. Grapes]
MIDGIGIDVVNIERMASLSSTALHRLFHEAEVANALLLSSAPSAVRNEYLAGRFAAKEALGKALGTGMAGFSPSEVCVDSLENGKPVMRLFGKAKELVKDRMVLLSISHDNPVATAIVLLQENP